MSAPASAPKKGIVKIAVGSGLGIATGAVAMYFNAAFNTLVKPSKPLANFQVSTDGLTVSCDNRATGQSGYWDFGDGTALEPFDPNQNPVQHAYTKPGKYDVKLLVRNFLMEENDRTVAVDLTAPPATVVASGAAPKIANLKVEAINDRAPATFRITGQLLNADEVVWKLGEKTEHLVAQPGPIDRYVTFDTAGSHQIVLTALSKTHADPQVIVQAVDVRKPVQDTYEAMVVVTDTVMRAEQRTRLVRVPAPIRDAGGNTRGFSRTIAAAPNAWIMKAELDNSMPKVAKNVKVEVAKDNRSVTVSGEWTTTGDALAKVAGGSDLSIPVSLVEEHRTAMSPVRQTVSGIMDANQTILVKLPPRPFGSATGTRTVAVDFGVSRREGGRSRLATGTLDAKGVWQSSPFQLGDLAVTVQAAMKGDSVQLTFAKAK